MRPQKTLLGLFGAVTILAGLAFQLLPMGTAYANQITSRSLTLQQGPGSPGDGGSDPGGVVDHLFTFTVPNTTTAIGSIQFEYCTTAADVGAGTCVTPTGLHTTSAALGTLSGISGYTLNNSTDGSPYITKASPTAISAPGNVQVQLTSVTNPTAANYTFFVRISDYASSNATGSPVDTGTVAASTANQVVVSGTMPESLVFCTGDFVGTTSGVPDCTTATNNTVAFTTLFSPTATSTATSMMAASTNAGSGYAITVNGTTLTSGSNTITAMGSSGPVVHGIGQFGMNLKLNTTTTSTPAVGAEIAPTSNGTNYRGEAKPSSGYDTVDNFKYASGDIVADSGHTVLGATDAQIYTVSYVVDVPGSQPAGTYTTTLTYICTPTF